MIFFHRLEDNLMVRRRGFGGMAPALWTLLWFWIPAHTLTFSLPPEFQVGLAALWSVVLGLILGLTARRSARPAARLTSTMDPRLGINSALAPVRAK